MSIPVNIQAMEDFVNSIPLSTGGTSGESSYSKAFHTAFQFFINNYKKDDERGETDEAYWFFILRAPDEFTKSKSPTFYDFLHCKDVNWN